MKMNVRQKCFISYLWSPSDGKGAPQMCGDDWVEARDIGRGWGVKRFG